MRAHFFSRMDVAIFTPLIQLCVPLRPVCVCVWCHSWISFKVFSHIFAWHAFDVCDVSQNILSFIRLFLYMMNFFVVAFAPTFSPTFTEHNKKCTQIKAHRSVTGYCICNFKLIYRPFSYLLFKLQLTPFERAFNFHATKTNANGISEVQVLHSCFFKNIFLLGILKM